MRHPVEYVVGWTVVDGSLQDGPGIYNAIQGWGIGMPFHSPDFVLIQECVHDVMPMGSCIIVHQGEFLCMMFSKWSYNGF